MKFEHGNRYCLSLRICRVANVDKLISKLCRVFTTCGKMSFPCFFIYVCIFLQATRQVKGGVDQEEQTNVLQGETTETPQTILYTHTHTLSLTMLFVVQLHSWQPGIKNPYRGMVVWPVPENIDISVTLFKVPGHTVYTVHIQTGDKLEERWKGNRTNENASMQGTEWLD